MNAFYEHHEHSIRFGYRCFDRILLNEDRSGNVVGVKVHDSPQLHTRFHESLLRSRLI